MKKLFIGLLVIILIGAVFSCGTGKDNEEKKIPTSIDSTEAQNINTKNDSNTQNKAPERIYKNGIVFESSTDESYTVKGVLDKNLEEAIIPEEINGFPVKSISSSAFSECKNLYKVYIPSEIVRIGDKAFYECTNLSELVFDAKCCTDLNTDNRSFYNAGKDAKGFHVIIRADVDRIPGRLFSPEENKFTDTGEGNGHGAYITHIEFEDGCSCKEIGKYAFYCNEFLREIKLPESTTKIGEYAFAGCVNLSSLSLSQNMTIIPAGCLKDCKALNNVIIPDGVTSIENLAFSGCIGLQIIAIPPSVASIGYKAFRECDSVKEIIVPDSVTTIGREAFSLCYSLETVKLPVNLTEIEEGLVAGSQKLKTINIPEGVISIGEMAFSATRITSIRIPESVTSIGKMAFNCFDLSEVVFADARGWYAGRDYMEDSRLLDAKTAAACLSNSYKGVAWIKKE